MLAVFAIIALWTAFVSSHMILSSRALRARFVALLGERLFQGVYSLVAFALFVPLVMVYLGNKHGGPVLWSVSVDGALLWLLFAVTATGFVFIVAGVMAPSPTAVLGGPTREPRGVQRLTRHPVFMGVALWSLAHLVANGHASDVAFFAGFTVLALLGGWHQDQRRLQAPDRAYESFCRASPYLPFTGRDTFKGLRELNSVAVLLGVAVTAVLRYFHTTLFV